LEIVEALASLGSDVNAVGDDKLTALHGAARVGGDKITEFLVSKGAKMDVMDQFGQTPLSIAMGVTTKDTVDFQKAPTGSQPKVADMLLKLGATPLEASGVKVLEILYSGKAPTDTGSDSK
jgi:hypothetical protein